LTQATNIPFFNMRARERSLCAMWIHILIYALVFYCPRAEEQQAIFTVLGESFYYTYRAEFANFGYTIDDNYIYHANLMIPPNGSEQLCSFPASMLEDTEIQYRIEDMNEPVAMLVSMGGCDTQTKVAVALEIHRNVTSLLRFVIVYNNSPYDPGEIVKLEPPPRNSSLAEGLGEMVFASVSTSTGISMLQRIENASLMNETSPEFLQVDNEKWLLKIWMETLDGWTAEQSLNEDLESGNFFWFRIALFTMLVTSPCFRAAYLWWMGGGRIRLRRDGNSRIIGFHYTPPMSYWFGAHVQQENIPQITDRLTEEEVMSLPEILYKPPPPDPDYVVEEEDGTGTAYSAKSLEDSDILVASGSADTVNVSKTKLRESPSEDTDTLLDEEQSKVSLATDHLKTTCTSCSICIDDFEAGERLRLLPRCRHAFHTECLLPWLTGRQGICPLCKTSVLEDEGGTIQGSETNRDFANNTSQRNRDDSNFTGEEGEQTISEAEINTAESALAIEITISESSVKPEDGTDRNQNLSDVPFSFEEADASDNANSSLEAVVSIKESDELIAERSPQEPNTDSTVTSEETPSDCPDEKKSVNPIDGESPVSEAPVFERLSSPLTDGSHDESPVYKDSLKLDENPALNETTQEVSKGNERTVTKFDDIEADSILSFLLASGGMETDPVSRGESVHIQEHQPK
jgi:hypothetical protein